MAFSEWQSLKRSRAIAIAIILYDINESANAEINELKPA